MSAESMLSETNQWPPQEEKLEEPQRDSSFTTLLSKLRLGDHASAEQLLARYWQRLHSLARLRIGHSLQSKVDPDDVLQSAFASFFFQLRQGRWDLDSSRNLQAILSVLITRKCARYVSKFSTASRDVRREHSLDVNRSCSNKQLEIPGREPAPEVEIVRKEWLEYLLARFDDQDRAVIAHLLDGFSTLETATLLKCSQRTVQRTVVRVVRELQRDTIASR